MCQHIGKRKGKNSNKEWPKLLQFDERHEPDYQTLNRINSKPQEGREKEAVCSQGPSVDHLISHQKFQRPGGMVKTGRCKVLRGKKKKN